MIKFIFKLCINTTIILFFALKINKTYCGESQNNTNDVENYDTKTANNLKILKKFEETQISCVEKDTEIKDKNCNLKIFRNKNKKTFNPYQKQKKTDFNIIFVDNRTFKQVKTIGTEQNIAEVIENESE